MFRWHCKELHDAFETFGPIVNVVIKAQTGVFAMRWAEISFAEESGAERAVAVSLLPLPVPLPFENPCRMCACCLLVPFAIRQLPAHRCVGLLRHL